jgi:SNF2 family DNA or RNA helicase
MNGYTINTIVKFDSYLLPEKKEIIPAAEHKYKKLHKYQIKAVDFILEKKLCALYLGMGLGKTVISLTAIVELLNTNTIRKILVIGPLRVINNVWHEEIAKWSHTSHLTYSIVTGTEAQRLEAFKKDVSIYLINRENVCWAYVHDYATWDMIVVDESSSFKNPSSKRFKALKKFKYEYMVQLTGTPSPNGLMDLWSQIYLLDQGKRLGKTVYHYSNTYFYPDYSGYNLICRNSRDIYSKIADITLSLNAKDYIDLPAKIKMNTFVDIGEHALYKELKKEFLTTIMDRNIVALNAAALTCKLLQFCNGAIYDAEKNIVEIHDAKLKALEEIIDDNPKEPILVAYNFRSDLIRLKRHFPTSVILDREGNQIAKWNNGEIKLLLCHPASCGKGLNLQRGGSIIVWFGLTWNLEDYLQFNSRIHRQGQKKPVIINHIVAKNCIDETVLKMLTEKKMSLDNLLDSLK